MSAETPEHVNNSHGELKSESIDLDSVFSQPSHDEWLEMALAGLPNHESLDSLCKRTLEGLTIRVLYDSYDDGKSDSTFQTDLSDSGWDNRLCISCGSDDTFTNKEIRKGLNAGFTSLQIQMNTATDLATVLKGVKLELAAVNLKSDNCYALAADAYLALAKTQALESQSLTCSFNADPVGTWLRGKSATQVDQSSLNALAKFASTISQHLPQAHTVLVDTTIHHNAGASAQQELVASIATASLYLEALLDGGLSLQQASRHIVFQTACDADILMGIVKIRSLKGLWQHLLTEVSKARNIQADADSANINIVVETSRRYLSIQDHWSNHLRNIAACTAAALASANTIIVHPHDKVDGWQACENPEPGKRLARNLPIILDKESALTKISDPTAGSFAIETLTRQLISSSWQSLCDINTANTWIETLASGQWQNQLTQTHQLRVQRLRDKSNIMVGVNKFNTQAPSTNQSIGEKNTASPGESLLKAVRDAEYFENDSTSATPTGVQQ